MTRKITRMLAWLMVITLIIGCIPIQNVDAAAKPKLNATKKTIVIGNTATIKVNNKIAGSKYKWSTSNKKIAKVTSKGKITAVKKGNATISCKVTSGKKVYNLKCTINVSNEVVAATQTSLNKALKNNKVKKVTIKTEDASKFNIPAGNYKKKDLVVNAGNSDVTNNGVFKSINIKAIKSDTWTENATGNKITVSAPTANIIVGKEGNVANIDLTKKNAQISLTINGAVNTVSVSKMANVSLTANGTVGKVDLSAPAALEIKGTTSKVELNVAQSAKGADIKASVPIDAKINANISLLLNAGAEGSTIDKNSANVEVTIDNNTSASVDVTTVGTDKQTIDPGKNAIVGGNDNVETPSNPTSPTTPTSDNNSSNGNGNNNSPTVTKVTVTPETATIPATGGTKQFTATVTGTYSPSQNVTWTIEGTNLNDGTSISTTGLLTVNSADAGKVITVKATSTVNTTKNGTAVVTVEKADTDVRVTGVSVIDKEVLTGSTTQLTAIVTPDNATDKSVTWTIENDNDTEATLTEGGSFVAGNTPGVVVVKAISVSSPSAFDTANITIKEPETTEPTIPEVTEPETTEPAEPETTEPETTEPTEPETTEPASTDATVTSVTATLSGSDALAWYSGGEALYSDTTSIVYPDADIVLSNGKYSEEAITKLDGATQVFIKIIYSDEGDMPTELPTINVAIGTETITYDPTDETARAYIKDREIYFFMGLFAREERVGKDIVVTIDEKSSSSLQFPDMLPKITATADLTPWDDLSDEAKTFYINTATDGNKLDFAQSPVGGFIKYEDVIIGDAGHYFITIEPENFGTGFTPTVNNVEIKIGDSDDLCDNANRFYYDATAKKIYYFDGITKTQARVDNNVVFDITVGDATIEATLETKDIASKTLVTYTTTDNAGIPANNVIQHDNNTGKLEGTRHYSIASTVTNNITTVTITPKQDNSIPWYFNGGDATTMMGFLIGIPSNYTHAKGVSVETSTDGINWTKVLEPTYGYINGDGTKAITTSYEQITSNISVYIRPIADNEYVYRRFTYNWAKDSGGKEAASAVIVFKLDNFSTPQLTLQSPTLKLVESVSIKDTFSYDNTNKIFAYKTGSTQVESWDLDDDVCKVNGETTPLATFLMNLLPLLKTNDEITFTNSTVTEIKLTTSTYDFSTVTFTTDTKITYNASTTTNLTNTGLATLNNTAGN